MNKIVKYVGLLLFISISASCAAQKSKVTRVDATTTVDMSGRWNDVDSRLVAEEMITSSLNESWLRRFRELHDGAKPVVIVGLIRNKTHEHIESETFINDMEREYIKAGLVRVVQHSIFREKLREERADQQDFADPATQKKFGKELGADFMIVGSINSIVDQTSKGKQQMIFYKVNLEITDLETNEIVWVGDKEIKKIVKK
ncbi:MAG: penicillin-binding protein activator LpoB [Cytophagales bacterium]|nr:MAG: penicillin-binding protein activator LpoB [Cytophagales bacterium]